MAWRIGRTMAVTALVALAFACGGEDSQRAGANQPAASPSPSAPKPAPAAAAPTAATAAEAAEIFNTRCVTCHGPAGAGDGPGSKGLTPAPRNFQDPAWQAEVSDDHIANIVMYGGAAVGRSPTMPGNPDLSGRPELVHEIVAHIRGLASE